MYSDSKIVSPCNSPTQCPSGAWRDHKCWDIRSIADAIGDAGADADRARATGLCGFVGEADFVPITGILPLRGNVLFSPRTLPFLKLRVQYEIAFRRHACTARCSVSWINSPHNVRVELDFAPQWMVQMKKSAKQFAVLRIEALEDRKLPAQIQPLFNEVKITTATDTHLNVSLRPDAGATEDGRAIVAWNRQRSSTDTDVQIKRFDAQGRLLAVNGTISVGGTVQNENQGRVAVRRDGSFVVVYVAPSL